MIKIFLKLHQFYKEGAEWSLIGHFLKIYLLDSFYHEEMFNNIYGMEILHLFNCPVSAYRVVTVY